jgi:metallophosphoesterase (TIGR03767 family)
MKRFAPIAALLAAAMLAVLALAAAAAPPKAARSTDAVTDQHYLRTAPGVTVAADRAERRRSLAFFAHLTDLHLADEASPARHEYLSGLRPAFSGFWRSQEAFGPHVVDQAVRAVNRYGPSRIQSAGGPASLGFTLLTGDLADNAQVNEVRWAVRALDGGRVDPHSGERISARNPCGAPVGVVRRLNRRVAQRRYAGVRASARDIGSRWPGVLHQAQQPFVAEGLAVPWFSVRGNHDALPQGHFGPRVAQPRSTPTGCRKVFPGARAASTFRLADVWTALRQRLPSARFVSPDPRRRFLRSPGEFRRLHGRADESHGFGFTPARERRLSRGSALYYAWSPQPDLRFVALDTTADAGGAGGHLDHPQYRWLTRELRRAGRRDQVVVVYAHHPLEMMDNLAHDELAGRFDRDPRDSRPLHLGRTGPANLRALLMRNPHVVLYLSGHKHYDRVWPNFRRNGQGFWQVITSALVGAPQEARLVELMDNADGTLSLFTTMLGHAAPAEPPASGPGTTIDPAGMASISRALARTRRAGGGPSGGGPMRNVELVVQDPRR